MNYREICRLALSRGYWQTNGKTPWATMGAQLYSHIRKRGSAAHFVQQGPETFGLNATAAPSQKASTPRKSKLEGEKKLSFTQAAEKILSERAMKEPMHYREITQTALRLGLLDTKGQTPEATMYAQILTEIRRYRARGEQPRFVQHGGGLVSLSAWMGKGLAFDLGLEEMNGEGTVRHGACPHNSEVHIIRLMLSSALREKLIMAVMNVDQEPHGLDVRTQSRKVE